MSGRAAGYCAGAGVPGFMNWAASWGRAGRIAACGFGKGGRGWRNRFYATGLPGWMRFDAGVSDAPSPDVTAETKALENRVQALRAELEVINQRLNAISGPAGQEK